MDISTLEGLGLTSGEIKVYLTLLELGSVKVGAVIEKSGLQSSVVHNCINKLIDKGFVSFIKEGKIKHYSSANPERIVEYIDDKKKKVQEIIPELLEKQSLAKQEETAEVYRGVKGLKTMYMELLATLKKGDENLFFINENVRPEVLDFFHKHDLIAKSRGIKARGLGPLELKDKVGKFTTANIKFVNFPIPLGLSLYKDAIGIFNWTEKPVGFLIRSKQVTDRYRNYFEKVWKIAKP